MTEHEQSMHIMDAFKSILAEVPGSLPDHQQRINSANFIKERLVKLDRLEKEAAEAATSEETTVPE